MSQAGISPKSLDTLQASISRSTTDYNWPRVLGLATQILELPDLPPESIVEVLRQRATAHEHMGQLNDAVAELETAVSITENPALTRLQIETLHQLADIQISNAAKFTLDGKIVVEVSIPRPPLLQIKVSDTGIGMNEQQLARVFEEFQQAESTTSRDYGGTDLGLPISKQLAQLLGGDLTATSKEGAGSTFKLALSLRYEG